MDAIARVRLEGHAMFALSAGRVFAGDKPHSLDVWNWAISRHRYWTKVQLPLLFKLTLTRMNNLHGGLRCA